MNVGKLYQINKYYWMLFPSKEKAVAAKKHGLARRIVRRQHRTAAASYLSKRLECSVSCIPEGRMFILLDQNGIYHKAFFPDGNLGWIIVTENSEENHFNEVKVDW